MKWLARLLLGIIIVLALAAIGVYIYIDTIAAQAVERGGTYATGVQTQVGSVRLKPFAGEVRMNQLTVDNPEGFDREHFVALGRGAVDVEPGSLMEEQVVIPRIKLSDLALSLERKDGKANYEQIMANLRKVAGSPEDQPDEQKQGKRYIIRELIISDIKVHCDMPLAAAIEQPITIADIRLENIGSDTDRGVLMGQLTGIIVQSVLKRVSTQLANVLPGPVVGALETGVGGIGEIGGMTAEKLDGAAKKGVDTLKKGVEKGADELEKGAKELEKGAKETIEGFGDMINGDDDQKEQQNSDTQNQ